MVYMALRTAQNRLKQVPNSSPWSVAFLELGHGEGSLPLHMHTRWACRTHGGVCRAYGWVCHACRWTLVEGHVVPVRMHDTSLHERDTPTREHDPLTRERMGAHTHTHARSPHPPTRLQSQKGWGPLVKILFCKSVL